MYGKAIQATIQDAIRRKEAAQVVCQLFKAYLASEAKLVNSLEENSQTCGAPAEAIKPAREAHAKAGQVGKLVCDAVARDVGLKLDRWPPGDFWKPSEFDSLIGPGWVQ